MGLRAVAQNRDLALILGLAAAQSFTRGALTVLSVVVAIELLGTGEPGVGALMTAVGVGAVLGSLAASLLVGTRRLGAWFAVGVALWGLPLALVGLVPRQGAALLLLAFVGVGNALIDVAGFTLLGRMAPDEVLARVFGVLESLVAVSIGIGAVVASWVVEASGSRAALIGIGLVCPVLALATWWRLRHLDRTVSEHDARRRSAPAGADAACSAAALHRAAGARPGVGRRPGGRGGLLARVTSATATT